jgi:hypothetical protein
MSQNCPEVVNGFVVGSGFPALPVTVCRFAMGGIFTTELYAEHKTFSYH